MAGWRDGWGENVVGFARFDVVVSLRSWGWVEANGGALIKAAGWMEVPGWRAAGWRKLDWQGLDGGKWLDGGRLDGGMDGVKMRLGWRGSMSCVVSRGSRFLQFTGVDGSWRFGSGLRLGSGPSCKLSNI